MSALTAAQMLRRGDLPHPGEHVVIHLTGTPEGCKVTVDTPDGRTDWTVEKTDGFYRANPIDNGGARSAGRFGNLIGILVRVARGDD